MKRLHGFGHLLARASPDLFVLGSACPIKAWPNRKLSHYPFVKGIDVTRTQPDKYASSRLRLFQQLIHLGHDLEGISNVEHVGLAAIQTQSQSTVEKRQGTIKVPKELLDKWRFLAIGHKTAI